MDREQTLCAALLWLRNHYEVGDPALKERVLAAIDRVFNDGQEPTMAEMRQFREKYTRELKS